jgi:hypothetical protein
MKSADFVGLKMYAFERAETISISVAVMRF